MLRYRSVAAWISTTRLYWNRIGLAETMPIHAARCDETDVTAAEANTPSTAAVSQASKSNLVVVIAGSTGVGKSDVAAGLCRDLKGMIVSADSVQAYPGVQIGANKPDAQELAETPHVLIDVARSDENYNAAEWTKDALFTIHTLLMRNDKTACPSPSDKQEQILSAIQEGKRAKGYSSDERVLPVVVGGTMMYLQWLVHGRPDAVRPTEEALARARSLVEEFESKNDWEGAVEHTRSLGSIYDQQVGKLSGRDWYRLRRILEVAYTVEGDRSDREDHGISQQPYSGERSGGLKSLGYDVRCFFLCPSDRMNHTRLVDRRCEDMVSRGLLKETTDLSLARLLPDMASKAIGYRQSLDYLEREGAKDDDEESFQEFLNKFTTATRRYAKRQMQWFRRDTDFVFVPVDTAQAKDERAPSVVKELERMIGLSRADFDLMRLDEDSVSARTRRENESQGKKMKTYQFKRHVLEEGSHELKSALAVADECTHRYQSKKPRR